MKILCIAKPTEAFRALPPDISLQHLVSFQAVATQQREERKILELYVTPIGSSVVILDYETADEWVKDQRNIPLLNYYEFEIYPLADGFEAVKGIIASLKAMKG